MEEQQWRSESVALDAPPTVQTTTVPAPKMPVGKQIPWKWVFGAGILVVALVAGLLFLRSNLAKNQEPTNNGQVKTQNVDLGKLAKNTTPLTLDKTDRVVINGQLQTTQGLVINPTAEPTTSVLGQVYLDSTTGDLRYYNGTTYLTIANSDAVGLTEVEVLALLTTFGTKLPQDLATTASPLFGGLKLSGTNGNAVLLQAAAGTANVTLTLPANGGTISQCLTTDGAGTLSFSACASGSGNAFLQGGNAFAATGVLGTTDNNDLNFITNNITRLTVAAGGNVGIGNATPGNKLSINSPTSPDGLAQTVIATGALANKGLVVQGVIFQSGSLLELQEHTGSSVFSVGATGNTSIRTATNSVTAFQVQNSAGSGVLNVDTNTSTGLVGIGIAPEYKLDVNGDINIVGSSALRIGGDIKCTASGCDATSGSGSYIQNGNGIQSNANFGIQSANATYIGAKVRGAAGQSASLLELQISNATPVFSVGSTGNVVARPSSDSATAFSIQNAAGTSNLFIADTNLNYVGIGIAPAYKLDVNGDINIVGTSALLIGGDIKCTASGCDATSGSGSYIQNGNGIQPGGANFAIQSANATYVGGVIKGAVSQSADLFQLQNSAGTNLFNVTATGAATFQNTSDTTGAFRVLDAAGTSNVLVVDTLNKRVGINTYPSGYALDVNGDVNLTSAVASLRITGTVVCNLAGCAASSGSGNYIQNGNGVQTNGNFAIQSANIGYVGGLIRGAAGQTADLLQIQNSGAANLFSVGATGNATFQNSADNSAAFNIKQSGGTTIFWADTLQGTINATNTAGNAFIGTTNNNLSYGVVGTQSFGVGGGVKGVGGGGYGVLGQSETNASGLFQTTNTAGTNTAATLVARANTNQSTSVFEVQNTAGTSTFSVGATGSVLAKNSTNSTTAFQIQNAAGNNYLLVNTSGASISVGDAGIASTIQIGNTTGAVAQTVNIGNNTTASSTTTTTVGSKIGTSPTKIQAGTSGVVVQAADSVNAFSVQNAAGTATLFNIDTTNSVININGNNSGTLQAWANTTAVGSNFVQHATVSNGSYLYRVAGLIGLSLQASVSYAPINPDGTVGAWANTTALGGIEAQRQYPGAVIANGYMYVIGGANFANGGAGPGYTQTKSIYYGAINSDGSISSWKEAAEKTVTAVGGAGVVAHNGYLYIIGGGTTADYYGSITPTNSVQYAKLNADGSVGSFCVSGSTCTSPLTAPPALTDARMVGQAIVSNGYLYYVGGRDGASIYGVNQKDIYRTLINSDGSLGAWTKLTGVLTTARGYLGVGVMNGYLYAAGGGVNSYEYAKIGASGSLGAFTQPSNPLTVSSGALGMATANGYFYIISGSNLGEVQYASGPRTYVGGSLDLVGLGGNGLQSSSGGGTLTAGNTLIAGRFQVTDAATFMQGVSIYGDISASGQAVFRSTTDSLTAFQIQNAAGEKVLIVNTAENLISPGFSAYKPMQSRLVSQLSVQVVSDYTNNGTTMAMGGDGRPIIGVRDTTNKKFVVQKCKNSTCSSALPVEAVITTSFTSPYGSGNDIGTYSSIIMQKNGLPIIAVRDTSDQRIFVIICTQNDCSSGNRFLQVTTLNAISGTYVTGVLGAGSIPIFFFKNNSSSDISMTRCIDEYCTAMTTEQKLTDGNNVGDYISASIGSDGIPVVAYRDETGTDTIKVTRCLNTLCDSFSSSTTNTISYPGNDIGQNTIMAIPSDGNPVIVTQNTTPAGKPVTVFKCSNSACSSISASSPAVVDDGTVNGNISTANFGMTIGVDDLPLITYAHAGTNAYVAHCGNSTCSSLAPTPSTIIQFGSYGNNSTPLIGNDGFPVIVANGGAPGGTAPAVNLNNSVIHCVDITCADTSSDTASVGVSLGSKTLSYSGVYIDTINEGRDPISAPLRVAGDKKVYANSLSSDTNGVVKVLSTSTTALIVQNSESSANILSVDAASSSVNIGTSTTVAGYGFNSAAASLFRNTTNSTSAFNIQNASGASLFSADTSGGNVNVTQGNFVINNFTTPSTPTTGTISNSSGTLSGAASTYYYKVTSVGVGGESAPSAELSVPLTPLTAPTAASACASTCSIVGNLTGIYNYKVTFLTANGETIGGATFSNAVSVTTKKIGLSLLPIGPAGTTQRRIYRTASGGLDGTQKLLDNSVSNLATTGADCVGTINNNTTTGCNDNVASVTATAYPASNTARTNLNSLSINFTAVTGAGSYNFYRSTSSGAELKCTVTAPTTITSSPATDNGTWTCGGTAASSVTGFGSKVGIGINAPTTSLDVRGNALFKNQTDTTTAFQIQNAAGNTILGADTANGLVIVGNETNAFYATLDSSALTANRAITFPDLAGVVCLSSGNCVGSGGSVGSSGGTANYLPKFTAAYNLENSILQETGGITILNEAGGFASGKASTTTGSLLFYNSTNANTITLQSGATAANLVLTLPTTAGSNGDCLQSNGFGVLSFNACTGGAGGGVTSIDGQTGVVTVNNATGSGGVLTIDDASTSAKGIASFNSTNFSVSSGAVNTIQNINTGATPQFAGVLANSLDTAAAGTLTIGGSTQTAISLGRAGITTTNAGALTVSQLLTAGLANSATLGNTGLAVSANADIDGVVAIGSGATPNAFYALGIHHDFTATTNPAGCPHVFFFGNVCSGVYSTANSNGLTGLTDVVAGGSFGTNNTGSTVLEAAYGLIVRSATNSSSGSIVSAVGLSVAPQTVGTSLNYGVSISTSSTSALQLGADLATPTTYNSGVSFGYDNDTVLFRTAAGQLALGTGAGATTLKLSPTAITSTGGLTINTTTSSTLTLDSGTTGAVNIGNSANAKAVTVGSSTGGSSLTLQAGTGTIGIGTSASTRTVNIATGAAAQTVTLGSSTGASSLLLASGTGGITFAGHIISGNSVGSTATAFAVGAAACTGGVATSSAGNDTAGKIVVTTGASGCAAGTIVTVTFGTTYTTAPMVVLTPGDSVTAGENLNYYATPTATTFVLGTQTTTTISKTLTFYYHVIR